MCASDPNGSSACEVFRVEATGSKEDKDDATCVDDAGSEVVRGEQCNCSGSG